ncbi:MAG: hypothetical protein J5632_00740 [Bacteroidales bacterium]|nr:hypothetical protein [Bacteroidales bacterium]
MKKALLIVLLATFCAGAGAQTDSLRAAADRLCENYDFGAAVSLYRSAQVHADSLVRAELEDRITDCVNGANLAGFCFKPVVVARERFALEDFFLFYPFADSSWHLSSGDTLAYCRPAGATAYAWSLKDSCGVSRLWFREKKDSVWGPAEAVQIPATGDAVFPFISGEQLYFSAKGLFGVGGFDLYVCNRKADGSWGEPANLGFPFSSPADDYLYVDSPDGKYSLFASSRGCSADSVNVYVIEYDAMPVRSAVEGAEALARLCSLDPTYSPKKINTGTAVSSGAAGDASTARYSAKTAEVRAVRDSISVHNRQLAAMRARYSGSVGTEREFLTKEIARMEAGLPLLQKQLSAKTAELQKIEMEFLRHGVVIDPGKVASDADKEVVGASSSYTFTKKVPFTPCN